MESVPGPIVAVVDLILTQGRWCVAKPSNLLSERGHCHPDPDRLSLLDVAEVVLGVEEALLDVGKLLIHAGAVLGNLLRQVLDPLSTLPGLLEGAFILLSQTLELANQDLLAPPVQLSIVLMVLTVLSLGFLDSSHLALQPLNRLAQLGEGMVLLTVLCFLFSFLDGQGPVRQMTLSLPQKFFRPPVAHTLVTNKADDLVTPCSSEGHTKLPSRLLQDLLLRHTAEVNCDVVEQPFSQLTSHQLPVAVLGRIQVLVVLALPRLPEGDVILLHEVNEVVPPLVEGGDVVSYLQALGRDPMVSL